jgi:hypothetical protein
MWCVAATAGLRTTDISSKREPDLFACYLAEAAVPGSGRHLCIGGNEWREEFRATVFLKLGSLAGLTDVMQSGLRP